MVAKSWVNTSGKVIVTDPCYNKESADNTSGWRISGTIENVMKGKWNCAVKQETLDGWGKRNMVLMTWNSYQEFPNDDEWSKEDFSVGVDSGEAGIFDYQKYPDGGVVSSSGIGDGIYDCLTHKNTAGKVDGIMLNFWGDGSDSEESELHS